MGERCVLAYCKFYSKRHYIKCIFKEKVMYEHCKLATGKESDAHHVFMTFKHVKSTLVLKVLITKLIYIYFHACYKCSWHL